MEEIIGTKKYKNTNQTFRVVKFIFITQLSPPRNFEKICHISMGD